MPRAAGLGPGKPASGGGATLSAAFDTMLVLLSPYRRSPSKTPVTIAPNGNPGSGVNVIGEACDANSDDTAPTIHIHISSLQRDCCGT